jgi:poly(A) polymerase
MTALEWAVECAERSAPLETAAAPKAAAADFRSAAGLYTDDVRRRLDRIVMSSDAEVGLDALLACGALGAILPEVEAMVGFGDGEWRHKDVWKHTKQVVRQAVPRLEVRWAALLHDIGKIKTRTIAPNGEVHFFGHAEVGARMFDKIDRRMPLFTRDEALKKTVRFLILHHLRASQYDASWTDSAVRRFAREMGDALDDVLNLSRADITTKRPEKKRRGLRQIGELADRVRRIEAADAIVPPLPSGIGDAIMSAFSLPPSRKIGDIKRQLEQAIASGEIAPHQPADAYIALLREHGHRFGL